jgi:pyruvate,orthophosphate dikinase
VKRSVYSFGAGRADGRASMRETLGGKGANLAEMTRLGIPVPPGFTISTAVCHEYARNRGRFSKPLREQVRRALARVERAMDASFGDPDRPLLLSVRSGAPVSMPGMMDTVLNLGLNEKTVRGLAALAGERFAYDSFRRFIQMYGDVVLGVPHERFESCLESVRDARGTELDTDLDAADLQRVVREYLEIVRSGTGKAFPQNSEAPASQRNRRVARHGGERAGHGIRQHGGRLRHGRGLHARPQQRREDLLRRVSEERAG